MQTNCSPLIGHGRIVTLCEMPRLTHDFGAAVCIVCSVYFCLCKIFFFWSVGVYLNLFILLFIFKCFWGPQCLTGKTSHSLHSWHSNQAYTPCSGNTSQIRLYLSKIMLCWTKLTPWWICSLRFFFFLNSGHKCLRNGFKRSGLLAVTDELGMRSRVFFFLHHNSHKIAHISVQENTNKISVILYRRRLPSILCVALLISPINPQQSIFYSITETKFLKWNWLFEDKSV